MIAKCEICDVIVMGKYVAGNPLDPRQRLAEYDSLAAHMWLHVSDFHPGHRDQGILCQQRAAKLYAMHWAKTDPEAQDTQAEWRGNLLMAMVTTVRGDGQAVAAPLTGREAPSTTSAGGAPSCEASKEKNESRNPSI